MVGGPRFRRMVPGTSSPNFCSSCGARLNEGAAFCSQCGDPVGDGSVGDVSRGAAGGHERSAFRERVREYRVNGWDVEQDYGDRVVVRKRGFGSIPAHVVLFFLTGGIGNVLYAWYRYGPGASRAELRADGRERWIDGGSGDGGWLWEAAGTVTGILLVAFLLFWLSAITGGDAVVGMAAVSVFLLLSVAYYLLSRRTGGRRSLTTFGRERSIDETPTTDGSESCVVCGRGTPSGVVREYAERFYVAGVPVWTFEEGENRYCRACAAEETAGKAEPSPEPVPETDR